jgi:MurNAc alpha-1-phosphate uridylyltransferase
MRAIILAAGRGERMQKLTKHTPKPLLRVNNHYLVEFMIASLRQAGIHHIVMNVSYLGDQIMQALGNGHQFGVNIVYSQEQERLETGGGILKALPLLGSDPFVVLSGDIISDYPIQKLPKQPKGLAHLVMVDYPGRPKGDFGLKGDVIDYSAKPYSTYGNIGVFRPEFFAGVEPGHFKLSKLLEPAIQAQHVTGEHFDGNWFNVGTPQELSNVAYLLRENASLKHLVEGVDISLQSERSNKTG